jgi:hypothetical protein
MEKHERWPFAPAIEGNTKSADLDLVHQASRPAFDQLPGRRSLSPTRFVLPRTTVRSRFVVIP